MMTNLNKFNKTYINIKNVIFQYKYKNTILLLHAVKPNIK